MHDIQHDESARRFSTTVEGQQARLDYELADGLMTITHTVVPQELGGRGIGGALVARAFESARAAGWRVRPSCSFAAAWAERHPQYADLLD